MFISSLPFFGVYGGYYFGLSCETGFDFASLKVECIWKCAKSLAFSGLFGRIVVYLLYIDTHGYAQTPYPESQSQFRKAPDSLEQVVSLLTTREEAFSSLRSTQHTRKEQPIIDTLTYSRDTLAQLLEEAKGKALPLTLEHALFSACNYDHMDIAYAELPGSQWEGSSLTGTDLRFTDLSGATYKDCDLIHVRFAGTGYFGTTFSGCNMHGIEAPGSDFSHASFTQVHVSHANFASSIMEKTTWTSCHLGNSVLDEASITESALYYCNLERVSARFTDFSQTNFFGSVLDGSDLSWANLTGARFPGASFGGVNLYGTLLEDIHLDSRRQIHIPGKISQSLFFVFSYIGQKACYSLASLLQEKLQGRCANEFPDYLTHQALQSVEDYNREGDDTETTTRKQHRIQMKQVALNFASGIIQHEPHTEGNPIAEIILGWLDEYLQQ